MQGVFQWTVNAEWVSLYDTPRSTNYFIGPTICSEVMFTPNEVHFFSKMFSISFPEQHILPVVAHLTNSSLPMPNIEATFRESADMTYTFISRESLKIVDEYNSILYGGEEPTMYSAITGSSYYVEFTPEMASGLFKIITETNKKDDYDKDLQSD